MSRDGKLDETNAVVECEAVAITQKRGRGKREALMREERRHSVSTREETESDSDFADRLEALHVKKDD